MTAQRLEPSGERIGCVVAAGIGVFDVLTDGGEIRVSLDGVMLGRVARDRSLMPVVGDWVQLRSWPDRRVTLRGVLRGRGHLADVVPLRAAGRGRS